MKKVYLDMDNTLADFSITLGEPLALERMYEKGFFRNLAVMPDAAKMVNYLIRMGLDVHILSACIDSPYVHEEKIAWLNEHLPMISIDKQVYTEAGKPKTLWVDPKGAFLLDDYGKNLREWRENGGMACRIDFTGRKEGHSVIYRLMDFIDYMAGRI